MRKLVAQPLTREAFEPFGDVIQTDGANHFPINNGTTERFHDLAQVQLLGENTRTLVNIFRGQPFEPPVTIRMLERHPFGSQAFVPLNGRPYLVAVAPPVDDIDLDYVRVFLARGDQGVNYHANVWHHPLLSLEAVSDFLVVDRAGDGNNCEERDLPEPVQLVLE